MCYLFVCSSRGDDNGREESRGHGAILQGRECCRVDVSGSSCGNSRGQHHVEAGGHACPQGRQVKEPSTNNK